MVVDGIAGINDNSGGWSDNTVFNFTNLGGSLTMDFGGSIYNNIADVKGDFRTVFQSDLGVAALSAVDNRDGTFTVSAIPEPGTYALLGGLLALGYLMVRRRR